MLKILLPVFPFFLAGLSLCSKPLRFSFPSWTQRIMVDIKNNYLDINLLDTWRWLAHSHRLTNKIISFFSTSSVFFSTWITPVALGSLQTVRLFTTEQSWAPDTVLLLDSPPCQVQWIIPSGALGRWWCIRSPWVPCTLFAAVSQGLSAEYRHCEICSCVRYSAFSSPCRDSPGLH